jgi:hypothetical protein
MALTQFQKDGFSKLLGKVTSMIWQIVFEIMTTDNSGLAALLMCKGKRSVS